MKTINQYYIINDEYNNVWFSKYLGKVLSEEQFNDLPGHSIIHYKLITNKINIPYKDD